MASSEEARPLDALAALPADLRGIGCDLLLYKSLMGGPWFETLVGLDPREDADTLRAIGEQTVGEATEAIRALQAWSKATGSVDELASALRLAVFEDLLFVKESTVEAFLRAGMRAPTDAVRREFLRLAEKDRRHAEDLREVLGVRRAGAPRRERLDDRHALGAHTRRDGEGTLSRSLQRVLDDLRRDGQEPAGIVLSAASLRHLRDEGALAAEDTTVFGHAVEVDFGWRGECFAVRTRDHMSLAELVLARRNADAQDAGSR